MKWIIYIAGTLCTLYGCQEKEKGVNVNINAELISLPDTNTSSPTIQDSTLNIGSNINKRNQSFSLLSNTQKDVSFLEKHTDNTEDVTIE